jgi:hypothetical protein
MAGNSIGRALGDAQNALSQPTGTTPQPAPPAQQADGLPTVDPGNSPTKAIKFQNSHTPHGTSGFDKVVGALADKLHKTRGR